MQPLSRRQLLLSSTAAPFLAAAAPRPPLCLFSKHAAQLNYKDLARYSKETGFDGVDLTVRPQGHVLPENVARDLPLAVNELRSAGLSVPMITTGLTDPKAPEASATLTAASQLKVPFWKIGYFRYTNPLNVDAAIATTQSALTLFAALSRQHNITAGFHNHSGNYVGAPIWDTRQMIATLDPASIGYYFDPAHATAEGGLWTWNASLEIALPRLKMMAVKDFYWVKEKGKWTTRWCPLGEGMVDWPKVFARLAKARWSGPLSLHVEYQTPDELKSVATDFATLKKLVDQAWPAA